MLLIWNCYYACLLGDKNSVSDGVVLIDNDKEVTAAGDDRFIKEVFDGALSGVWGENSESERDVAVKSSLFFFM